MKAIAIAIITAALLVACAPDKPPKPRPGGVTYKYEFLVEQYENGHFN